MNKRDAIIIAVLVNAGLLIILLVGALTSKSSSKAEEVALQNPQTVEQVLDDKTAAGPSGAVNVATGAAVEELAFDNLESGEATAKEISHKLPEVALDEQKEAEMPATETEYVEVVVKRGDSLDKIARNNHTSIAKIKEINKLTKNVLRIGQVLKVEAKGSNFSASKEVEYYTVKVGDNPWTIAMKHHIKTKDLLKLNNLTEAKARKLKAGDKLRVR